MGNATPEEAKARVGEIIRAEMRAANMPDQLVEVLSAMFMGKKTITDLLAVTLGRTR